MNADLKIAVRDSAIATRPYVIVNPLLGKHLPSVPSATLSYFSELAVKVKATCAGERVLVIGFAETATAVGAAVASEIDGAIYVHTTREDISSEKLIAEFLEEHSHARNQALFLCNEFRVLTQYDRIVFVEDEITTGKTILNFLHNINYNGKITVSALVFNGFDETVFANYAAQFCCVQMIGYVTTLVFAGFLNPRQGVNTKEYCTKCEELAMFVQSNIETSGKSILVLGTEEFMYPAIIVGQSIEKIAENVKTHSTTRSPLLAKPSQDYPLQASCSFPSVYEDNRKTYLYNLDIYDIVIIITDSQSDVSGLLQVIRQRGNNNICIVRVSNAD
jgi:orotate phosphoribosyltransferase